ncbi:MAG TPA: carboxypeptidase regulatory-like domain-containing protein, partial [Gemmatales bacterium]|nr:carboxypeptidase regulatory-like domain-containing protein [Gemmatales bacterium]
MSILPLRRPRPASPRPTSHSRDRYRFRPMIEALEDRTLPSIVPISISDPRVHGASANNHSGSATISADGQVVVFASLANNVLPGASSYSLGANLQVFVHHLSTGTSELVSVGLDGSAGNASSRAPLISPDGRFVAFHSFASNLVNLPSHGLEQLYVRDLQSGTTQLVSVNQAGTGGGNSGTGAFRLAFSADGRYLAFESGASDLVAGDSNGDTDVFIRDLVAQATVKVTQHLFTGSFSTTVEGNMQFSADHRWLLFTSRKSQLAIDTNGVFDVYQFDLQTQTLHLASLNAAGTAAGNLASDQGWMSDDGRFVAFRSQATDLLGTPTAGANIFVRDMVAGSTILVSATPGGQHVNNTSDPWISPDGRYVFFEYTTDFFGNPPITTPGPGNGSRQVYRRDLQTSTTIMVTTNTAGTGGGNGASDLLTVSPDARYVVMLTLATNLSTLADANGVTDLLIFDLQTGDRRVISRNLAGTTTGNNTTLPTNVSNGDNFYLTTVAGNNRWSLGGTTPTFVFPSLASDLVADDNNLSQDVFVYRWSTDAVELISRRSPLLPAAFMPAGNNFFNQAGATAHGASADGRYVLFTSISSELTSSFIGIANYEQVYVRDAVTGQTQLVSINAAGTGIGFNAAFSPRITPDGRYVLFLSRATDYVTGISANGSDQVYIRDLQTQTTQMVSVATTGTVGANSSVQNAVVSADGRYVAFTTSATNLVAGIPVSGSNVYVRDMVTGTTTLATINAAGTASGSGGFFSITDLALSADGRWLLFTSDKTDLTTLVDNNATTDVFLRDLLLGVTHCVSVNLAGTGTSAGGATEATMSSDGRYISFRSVGTDLVATPVSGNSQAYVRDRVLGTTTLVSFNAAGTASTSGSIQNPVVSANGRYVLFMSFASDLVVGLPPTSTQLYLRDLQTGITRMVDVNAAGTAGSSGFLLFSSYRVSDDGNLVVFIKQSGDLVVGASSDLHVYARDMAAGITTLLTPNLVPGPSAHSIGNLSLVAGGSLAIFSTNAGGLYAGDTNNVGDVYMVSTVAAGGVITGTVFLDLNQNGDRDPGELGLAGVTIYIDQNDNGVRDPGEFFVVTASDGSYSFAGLTAGSYLIRQDLAAGFTQTFPAGNAGRLVTLNTDSSIATGEDFGTFRLPADLLADTVIVPVTVAPGQTFTVTWTTRNVGGSAAIGPWEDAIYLSVDGILNPSDYYLGSLFQTSPLGAGDSRIVSLTVTAPIAVGSFNIIVQTDRRKQVDDGNPTNNVSVGQNRLEFTLTVLQLGVPLAAQFSTPGQTLYFQLELPQGDASVLVAATRPGGQVRMSWGNAPPFSETGTLLGALPSGNHLLAVTDLGPIGATNQFTLLATQPGASLRSATPGALANGGLATLRIDGTDLVAGTQFRLVGPGGIILPALTNRYITPIQAEATFDLTGQPPGSYALQAVLPGGSVIQLPTPLSVAAAPLQQSLANLIDIQMSLPAEARALRTSVFYVRVTNTSGNDLPTPLLLIRSPSGALLSTAAFTSNMLFSDGSTPTLQVLAASTSTTPGILRAGEEVVIPIYFHSHMMVTLAGFEVFAIHADDAQPLSLSMIEQLARPVGMADATWAPIFAHLVGRIGSTQGDYVRFLGTAADLLADGLNRSVTNLLSFEVARSRAALGRSVQGTVTTTDPQVALFGKELRLTHRTTGELAVALVLRDGTFFFTDLDDGDYDLTSPNLVLVNPPVITVQGGQAVTGVSVAATRAVRVSGYIVQLDGLPVQNAVVMLLGGAQPISTRANLFGYYEFNAVHPDTYDMIVSAPGMAQTLTPNVVVGQDGLVRNVALVPESRIHGTVTFAGPPPAAGTLAISVRRQDGNAAAQPQIVVDGSSFLIRQLPSGVYDIIFSVPGYRLVTLTDIVVAAGETLTLPALNLGLGASVSGSVSTTVDGLDVEGLFVGAYDDQGNLVAIATTDVQGGFGLIDFEPGSYTLRVINLRQGVSTQATVNLPPGGQASGLTLQVTQGAVIRGEVREVGSNAPIVGAVVMAIDSAGQMAVTQTDATGSYEITQVGGGTYRVSLAAAGASAGTSQQVTVTGSDGEEV